VTDQDLLIKVKKSDSDVVIKNQTENFFGLVAGGHIMLYSKLRKIKLAKEERAGLTGGSWSVTASGQTSTRKDTTTSTSTHYTTIR
jgi:hypothetical protein